MMEARTGWIYTTARNRSRCFQKSNEIFYSLTFGSEPISMAAAIATIKFIKQNNVLKKIDENGSFFIKKLKELIKRYNLNDYINIVGFSYKNILAIKGNNNISADLIRNYKRSKETPAKIEKAVNEVINVVDKKEKVVVWASFVRTIQRMQDELKKRGYDSFTVTGKVPQDEEADPNDNREKRIEDFKTTDTNVLVANPASCAESISLHKHCQKALYLDRNFNGAQYMQSLARIHRVGMGKIHPKYLMLLSEDSIDEDVDIRLTFKHEQMLNFLNDDFPVLSLDLDNTSVFGLKNEQKADFEQYFKRIKKRQSQKR